MDAVEFKLVGGGLVDRILPAPLLANTRARLVIMLIAWAPLLVLSLIAGNALGDNVHINFLGDPIPYARFLICLPLFLVAEAVINGRLSAVVSYIWGSNILGDDDRERFQKACDEVLGRRASVATDIAILIIAYGLAWIISSSDLHDGYSTWFAYDRGAGQQLSAAGWWYTLVSLPLYLFVFLRWCWRISVWWRFLWRFARLDLRIMPSHPDRVGGLGILEMAQLSFGILVFAVSAIAASELADLKLREGFSLLSAVPTIAVYLVCSILFIVGPLLLFAGKLYHAKLHGLIEYGDLADDLFGSFAEKWTDRTDAEQSKLLGNVDPSSLADYGYVYEVVTQMRLLPFSTGSLMKMAVTALLPFTPLLLMDYSLKEIMNRLMAIVG